MNDELERFRVLISLPREGDWWDQARSEFASEPERVPELARPLLGTEVRTASMSHDDAVSIRDWARELPGWEEDPGLRLLRYPSQAEVDWREL